MGDKASLKQLVDITSRGGEAFVKDLYYKVFDSARKDLVRFYKDTTKVVWNGKPYQGTEVLAEFFLKLPDTEHEIKSIDIQHVPGTVQGRQAGNILVVVVGTVVYDGELEKDFSQSLLLTQEPGGKYYIANDTFRFIV